MSRRFSLITMDPGFGACGGDVEVEAVAVPAGAFAGSAVSLPISAPSHIFSHTVCGTCWHFTMPNGKVQGANISEANTTLGKMRLYWTVWEVKAAERAGFEPARNLRPYAISSRARSSTPAPLRAGTIPSIIGSGLDSRKFGRRWPGHSGQREDLSPALANPAGCVL